MDWFISVWSELTKFIADYGLLAVAPIVMATSAGVPVPVPADLLVVLIGIQAREGHHPLWLAWLVLSASMFAGATLYEFARWIGSGGIGDVAQYGRHIGLTEGRLKDAEHRIAVGGQRAIFVARVVPGLKTVIVVTCGVPRVSWMGAAVADAMWWSMFGVLLGLIYPLFVASADARAEPV